MLKRQRIPALLFYGLTALEVVICIICFASAVLWINGTFAGFLVYKDTFVSVSGSGDWPGPRAGLKFGGRIVAVDDHPIQQGRDLVEKLKEKTPGTLVRYTVESDGQIDEVVVPAALFTIKDFAMVFLIPFLLGLIIYVLGFVVYVLKPNTAKSWVFLIACFCLGTMILAGFENQSSYMVSSFFYLINALWPFTLFHLFMIFPDKKRILTRFPLLEYLIYLPAAILMLAFEIYIFVFPAIFSGSGFEWFPTYRELGRINGLFRLGCIGGMIFLIFHAIIRPYTIMGRQRAKVIFWGVAVAFGPPVLIMTLFFFIKVNVPWNFLAFFVIFFPAAIAYSIVKHNLFDADVIIKRTVGYFIITAIVIGVYGLLTVSFNYFMGQYQVAQSQAFPILFTLGIILIFNPLRNRVQAVVDRIFFRKEYDYSGIVDKVGGAMTTMLELPQILSRLVQTFMEDMFIDTSSVMLLSPGGAQYQVSLAGGEREQDIGLVAFERETPLMGIIEARKRELTKYDVLEDPEYSEQSESCLKDFEALRASLIVPLVFQDEVIGSLNLGEKKSGKPYNREDIDLLRTLANQGAIAIENARLFQENLEKQRMEEELNIARDLQMSMLPSENPTIEGLDIAAYSVSAMEVGGDFYDFIDMGDKKLGFVIGDVTGKSVSGALVMSASRSVFRMLSEESHNVSESMIRANRRLKKDVKTGMFVALLYAVIDAGEQTLTLCNAGQTQPIQLSAKAEEAHLLETEGDTFPLGILEEADYEETRRQLEPGDKVIFYTDGIVEAMNEEEEMFGFERLLEVVQGARSMDADTLLNEILAKVDEFVGDAPQHDDLTVIIVGVEERPVDD